MKRHTLLLGLLCLAAAATACHAKDGHGRKNGLITPDSVVCRKLGKSLTEIIFHPTSVRCYTVKNVREVNDNDILLDDNFVVDSMVTRLKAWETAVLQWLLPSDKANYNGRIGIRSPYMPQLAFLFKRGKQSAWLLISLSDMTWSIRFYDKIWFNHSYEHAEAIERFCNYFISQQQH